MRAGTGPAIARRGLGARLGDGHRRGHTPSSGTLPSSLNPLFIALPLGC